VPGTLQDAISKFKSKFKKPVKDPLKEGLFYVKTKFFKKNFDKIIDNIK
jgi:hypothetical protein